MTRWYVVGPLLGLSFVCIVTWHWFEAGLALVLAALVWEIADTSHQKDLMEEIERYANDDHDS